MPRIYMANYPPLVGPMNSMARRSLAHWGYDDATLDRFAGIYEVDADYLATSIVFVADEEVDGEAYLRGFILARRAAAYEGLWSVMRLFVDPRHLDEGLGRVLWLSLGMYLRTEQGATRLVAAVHPKTRGFFEKLGCREIGESQDPPYPDGPWPVYEGEPADPEQVAEFADIHTLEPED